MIRFYTEDIKFDFKQRLLTRNWLKQVALSESRQVNEVNIIFCSDSYLLDINKQYLNHSYYTDIITFDYCDGNKLSGDLFISIDTVRDNSKFYNSSFSDELYRVIVHGLLHLIGYDDHNEADITEMRSKEDYYLNLKHSLFND